MESESKAAPLRDESTAARRLHCDVKTMQAWRYRGGGPPFIKIGRLVRYLDSDIEAYINSRRRTSTTRPPPPGCSLPPASTRPR